VTAVGFGDTVPASPLPQMPVIFEAIMGLIRRRRMVSYSVSMYVTHNITAKKKDE
jgi:hypothetical protein